MAPKNKIMSGAVLATAAASLLLAGHAIAEDVPATKTADTVKCAGINECKGTGACGGAGHACAGHNECKGQGWVKVTAEECAEKGGTVL